MFKDVSMILDKLPAIRGDLVRDDPDWENWDFVKLAEAIKQWTKRNPVYEKEADAQSGKTGKYGKVFHTKATKVCVYCEGEHKTGECTVVTSVSDRRGILARKKLCFNCATGQHVQMLVPVSQHAGSATNVTTQVYVMLKIESKMNKTRVEEKC